MKKSKIALIVSLALGNILVELIFKKLAITRSQVQSSLKLKNFLEG